jgi:hypothetical protein
MGDADDEEECGRFPVDESDLVHLRERNGPRVGVGVGVGGGAGRRLTMPGFNLGSRLSLDGVQCSLFSSSDNRLLDPAALMKTNNLILTR